MERDTDANNKLQNVQARNKSVNLKNVMAKCDAQKL